MGLNIETKLRLLFNGVFVFRIPVPASEPGLSRFGLPDTQLSMATRQFLEGNRFAGAREKNRFQQEQNRFPEGQNRFQPERNRFEQEHNRFQPEQNRFPEGENRFDPAPHRYPVPRPSRDEGIVKNMTQLLNQPKFT